MSIHLNSTKFEKKNDNKLCPDITHNHIMVMCNIGTKFVVVFFSQI